MRRLFAFGFALCVAWPAVGCRVEEPQGIRVGAFPSVDDSYVIVERAARSTTPTDVQNGRFLRLAYARAKLLTPGGNALSATNRAALIVPPGVYDLGTGITLADLTTNHGLVLDTEFVDLIGLTGKREDVVITSQIVTASRGTVEQTADDVEIRAVTLDIDPTAYAIISNETDPAAYFPDDDLPNTRLVDVECTSQDETNAWSMRIGIELSGTFVRCTGGTYSLGGGVAPAARGTASGTFDSCVGGANSFGGDGTASGTFNDCVGGDGSFNGWADSGLTAVMRRCRSTGRTTTLGGWQGLMIDCEIETSHNYPVTITGVARVYRNVLLSGPGPGSRGVYAAGATDALIAMLITNGNTAVDANITNLVNAAIADANAIIISDLQVTF